MERHLDAVEKRAQFREQGDALDIRSILSEYAQPA
jgi:hypothetical protein